MNKEDVLNAFAIEEEPGKKTLERYLRDYPEYAGELIDLSREIHRKLEADAYPLSKDDMDMIDGAWNKHHAIAKAVQVKKNLGHLKDFYTCRCSGDFTCTPCLTVRNTIQYIDQLNTGDKEQ
jgi:hypothetical protein